MISKFSIDVDAVKDLQRQLAAMAVRVTDFSVPLTEGSKLFFSDIKDAISTSGASWGEPWAEHAPGTEERWGSHPMMRLTDGIAEDLQRFVRPTMAGAFTRDPTVRLHERGRGRGWRSVKPNLSQRRRRSGTASLNAGYSSLGIALEMPSRYVMGFREDTIDLVLESCLDYAIGQQGI